VNARWVCRYSLCDELRIYSCDNMPQSQGNFESMKWFVKLLAGAFLACSVIGCNSQTEKQTTIDLTAPMEAQQPTEMVKCPECYGTGLCQKCHGSPRYLTTCTQCTDSGFRTQTGELSHIGSYGWGRNGLQSETPRVGTGVMICPQCNNDINLIDSCGYCGGRGRVTCTKCGGTGQMQEQCSKCTANPGKCDTCNGSGRVTKDLFDRCMAELDARLKANERYEKIKDDIRREGKGDPDGGGMDSLPALMELLIRSRKEHLL